ncbi:MAG: hypothetical protein JXA54_09630 [Candidatus Heimdallarchaeota archaeon]|nr:hypothetical protein [Candidatus Heimdallarchaeota archaeon]
MVGIPYKEGDTIMLNNQYSITGLLNETDEYLLFEGNQISNNRKVMMIIFANEKFTSIEEVENAWNNEIQNLQEKTIGEELEIEIIESGIIDFKGENQYVIIIRGLTELNRSVKQAIVDIEKEEFPSTIPRMVMGEDIKSQPQPIMKKDEPTSKEVFEELELAEEDEDELKEMTEVEKKISVQPPLPPTTTTEAPTSKLKRKKESLMEKQLAASCLVQTDESEDKDYLKHISMNYFDRMNPQNYYPYVINISDIKQEKIITIQNPITGERQTQQRSQIATKLENPIVKIRPTIPGCNVVPNEIETDFDKVENEVTFYVTPVVKGKIIGQIQYINEGSIIHTTEFTAKVVDPRYARAVVYYGILTSFIPKIISLLGIDFGLNLTLNDLWSVAEGTFGNMSIASLIAIGGIIPVVVISILVRQKLRPKSCKIQYKISDFKFKNLKIQKTS